MPLVMPLESASPLLFAPAKVNLSLRVGGRNDCGLHALESHIVFLELHDQLEVHDREDGGGLAVEFYKANSKTHCKTHFKAHSAEETFPVCEDHSLARAARALAATVQSKSVEGSVKDGVESFECAWNIVVQKAIPAGAGLGGGSSDAASFLRYAREKISSKNSMRGFNKNSVSLSAAEWLSVARAVGSDVALFFLRAKSNSVFVSGYGERVLEQAALPVCGVVLLCGAELSTKAVYERYARDRAEGRAYSATEAETFSKTFSSASKFSKLTALLEAGGNDLLAAACALDGSIVERLSALRSCEEVFCARMTGSGSACFGLTELGCEEDVAECLRARGWRGVIATRFRKSEAGEGVDKAGENV